MVFVAWVWLMEFWIDMDRHFLAFHVYGPKGRVMSNVACHVARLVWQMDARLSNLVKT